MRWQGLAVLLCAMMASNLHAGSLLPWRKTEKPDPKVRVPLLLHIVQNDKEEFKRSEAIVELRQYDAAAFPEMIPVLLQALSSDPRPGVRIDAAQTLSKLRPIHPKVGEALEQAISNDPSLRVRLQARTALLGYQMAGYRNHKKPDAVGTSSPVVSPQTPAGTPSLPMLRPSTEKRSGIWGGPLFPWLRTAPTPAATARPGLTHEPPLAEPPSAPSAGPLPSPAPRPGAVPPSLYRPTTPPVTPEEGPILP